MISSPCSRMIWPISPGPGSWRWRAVSSKRNSRAPGHRAHGADATAGHVEPGAGHRAVLLALLDRQPEQLADDQERHREREGLRQVDGLAARAEALGLVELVLDDPLDRRLEPRQPAHRELRRQQPAQPRVVGRVGEPQSADVAARAAGLAHVGADVGGVRRLVGQQLAALRVAGHQPHLGAEERDDLGHRALGLAGLGQPGRGLHALALQRPGQPLRHPVQPGQVDARAARDEGAAYPRAHRLQQHRHVDSLPRIRFSNCRES